MKVRITTPCRIHLSLIDENGYTGRVDGGIAQIHLHGELRALQIDDLGHDQPRERVEAMFPDHGARNDASLEIVEMLFVNHCR